MLTTADDLLRRCEDLAPTLEARAAEAETLRRLPDATVADLTDAGFFSLLAPTTVGGGGSGLEAIGQCTRALAHGCPATAWTASFFALHQWFLAHFPPEAQAEVFGGGRPVLAPAALAPTGSLTPDGDGYRLTGRWSWATGVMHADWVVVTGVLAGEGRFELRFCLLPISDVTIEDVWFMAGMRATGSNDVVVEDVVVPAHRTVDLAELTGDGDTAGSAGHPDPFLRMPLQPVLTLTAAAPALGAAERAVEWFRDRMASRVLAYSLGDRQADQPAAQVRLATALATVRAARAVWEGAIRSVERASATGPLSVDHRAASRLSAAHTVKLAREAINVVAEGAGASAYAESSPLQRLQRDVETLKGHVVFDWDRTAELTGRIAVGQPPRPGDLL